MPADENLELIRRRFGEHPILGDAGESLAAIYAPDVVLYGPGERFEGAAGIAEAAAMIRAAFSDIEFTVESMEARGDDRVVTHISGRSRHTGEFQGVPPSGEWVIVRAVVSSVIRDGRIAEEWRNTSWSKE